MITSTTEDNHVDELRTMLLRARGIWLALRAHNGLTKQGEVYMEAYCGNLQNLINSLERGD